jgi:hypothetical protein
MRDVYLKDAQRDLDANRVISIFNSWKQLNPVTNNRNTDNQRRTAKELEMQVAPGTKNSTVSTQQRSDAKQWRRADIAKFYDDVRRGAYKGKDDQRAQVEGDIFQAQRDNRVVA